MKRLLFAALATLALTAVAVASPPASASHCNDSWCDTIGGGGGDCIQMYGNHCHENEEFEGCHSDPC